MQLYKVIILWFESVIVKITISLTNNETNITLGMRTIYKFNSWLFFLFYPLALLSWHSFR